MKWINPKEHLPEYGKRVLGIVRITILKGSKGGRREVELVHRKYTDNMGEHWEVMTKESQGCNIGDDVDIVELWAEVPNLPTSSSDTDSGK